MRGSEGGVTQTNALSLPLSELPKPSFCVRILVGEVSYPIFAEFSNGTDGPSLPMRWFDKNHDLSCLAHFDHFYDLAALGVLVRGSTGKNSYIFVRDFLTIVCKSQRLALPLSPKGWRLNGGVWGRAPR